MKHYLHQVLIAIDQLFNALLLGWADETLSSRAYRAWRNGRLFGKILKPLIDGIFAALGDDNHCEESYMSEKDRRQNHPEFRD